MEDVKTIELKNEKIRIVFTNEENPDESIMLIIVDNNNEPYEVLDPNSASLTSK